MFQVSFKPILSALVAIVCCVSCGMFPNVSVWLKSVSFQVDPQANGGVPFVCHVVVPYRKDIADRLAAMDAKAYFNSDISKATANNPDVQVFKFDLIPGKNVIGKEVNIKSYSGALGAYLFAKYSRPGKFTANIGSLPIAIIKCTTNSIQLISTNNLKEVFGPNAK